MVFRDFGKYFWNCLGLGSDRDGVGVKVGEMRMGLGLGLGLVVAGRALKNTKLYEIPICILFQIILMKF